ncbi:MAG: hypothetical protein ABI402_04715 [Ferruginibacter sp.]
MKLISRIFLPIIIAVSLLLSGCDKTKPYDTTIPEAVVHFDGDATQIYLVIIDPAPVYNIVVGTSDVSKSDRIVTYHVSSPSGAIEGTHYTIDHSGTLTIPAGKAEATIDIRAIFTEYAGGRRDTLIFSLAAPSINAAPFMDTVKVILKGPTGCVEDIVDVNGMLGDYANTIETLGTNAPYGPYTTSISSVVQTSASTATIVVENLFDDGWGPITFLLDWTDANNRTCIVVPQDAIPGSEAGHINATYTGMTVAERVPTAALSATPGTYSYCDGTFKLKMQLGVTGVGWFNALYTVNMAR